MVRNVFGEELIPSEFRADVYAHRADIPWGIAVPRHYERPKADPGRDLVLLINRAQLNPVFRVRMNEADQFFPCGYKVSVELEFRLLRQFQRQRTAAVVAQVVVKQNIGGNCVIAVECADPDGRTLSPTGTAFPQPRKGRLKQLVWNY